MVPGAWFREPVLFKKQYTKAHNPVYGVGAFSFLDEMDWGRQMERTNIMKDAKSIGELSRDELLALTNIYAKNWLAHDGSWFLSIEERYDIDTAIEMDREAWRKFTVVEARRLIAFLELGEGSGLDGLGKALSFRLYALLNEADITRDDEDTLVYRVKTCRVQYARERKKLDYFPCKSVGIVEYGLFAKTIDQRIETEAISCHPDLTEPDCHCVWKFTLK